MRLKFLLLAFFFLGGVKAVGQFYSAGQAPASVRWMQINTDKFQIIYPAGFYVEANRVANILNYTYLHSSQGYSRPPKKISILLYNQSVESNAFVIWAPKRSEWVTTPPQDAYAQDWLAQLAIHEYRHVVQLNNLEQGLTKFLEAIFGQMAVGAVAAYLPPWYLEGDAVGNETALSSTGRGRDANFSLPLRAIEKEDAKRPSYDEAILGTYKTYLPNHYNYGYQMVTYGRLKYGNKLWRSTLNNVADKPFLLVPFYRGLKKNGAGSKVKLYEDTFDSLKLLWNKNLPASSKVNHSIYVSPSTKTYTNYLFPTYIDGKILAVKSGINDLTRFVFLTDSSETKVFTPGQYYQTPISVGHHYIAWEETQPDIRWQQVSYSVIKLYNYKTHHLMTLDKKTRLFSPSLSCGEDSLVVVEAKKDYTFSLLIYTLPDRKIVWRLNFPREIHISDPVWVNEKTIAFIETDLLGKYIKLLDIQSHKTKELFFSGYCNIANLDVSAGKIYFSYDKEQQRNIYCLNISSKKLRRLTRAEFGADYACAVPQKNLLYFSDYTVNGYRISKINLKKDTGTSNSRIPIYHYAWADSLSKRADFNLQKTHIDYQHYDSSRYRRLPHAFYLHSWAPFYFDPTAITSGNINIYPGFTLLSQNKLSTVTSSLSYHYYNKTHYLEPKITWQGIFPVVEFSGLFSSSSNVYILNPKVDLPRNRKPYYQLSLSTWLPLNLSRNKYHIYLQPRIKYSYLNRYYYDTYYKTGYDYLEYSMFFQNALKSSYRDIYTRFGQVIYLSFDHSLSDPSYFSKTFTAIGDFYFPGIVRHHSLLLATGYEQQIENKPPPILINRVSLPRGYFTNYFYTKIERLSLEYTLPLFYPDWSLGPIVYFKRFQASAFYDWGKTDHLEKLNGNIVSIQGSPSSAGFTLGAEVNFLRFFVPFNPQFTFSWLIPERKIVVIPQITVNTSF